MLDYNSVIYNLKYKNEGVKLVDPMKYMMKIITSRDENSSGIEYIHAQRNNVDDYNETARELLALYH